MLANINQIELYESISVNFLRNTTDYARIRYQMGRFAPFSYASGPHQRLCCNNHLKLFGAFLWISFSHAIKWVRLKIALFLFGWSAFGLHHLQYMVLSKCSIHLIIIEFIL